MNSITSPYIFKTFDASTGHITKRDNYLLMGIQNYNPLVVYPYNEGCFVHTADLDPDMLKEVKEYGFSEEFITLLTRAKEHGCKFLCLDADGIEYEDLPFFNW